MDSLLAGNQLKTAAFRFGYRADVASRDHGDPGDAPSVPPPLTDIANAVRPSAAEEARTIAASGNACMLATLTATGEPWASMVTYGLLDGAPVLCVTNMAEHGRNLLGDQRASIVIVAPSTDPDPLASGRMTLAGVVERPSGDELAAARDAYLAAVPAAKYYVDYTDFTMWVLRVQRVRWVGGYGRMESATAEAYAAAQPDPVQPYAAGAIATLNADHAEALCAMAKSSAASPTRRRRRAPGADRYGLDLKVKRHAGSRTPGSATREPIDSYDDLRSATVELTRRARIGA